MQGIAAEKVLQTVRIVRFALATQVIDEAEPVFEALESGKYEGRAVRHGKAK